MGYGKLMQYSSNFHAHKGITLSAHPDAVVPG